MSITKGEYEAPIPCNWHLQGYRESWKTGCQTLFLRQSPETPRRTLRSVLVIETQELQPVLVRVFCQVVAKYPWKLGDKEEPPLEDPAKMTHLASVQVGEHSRKSEVEAALVAVSLPSLCVTESVLPRYIISESKTGLLTNLRAGVCATTTSAFSSSFNVSTNPPTTNHANDL